MSEPVTSYYRQILSKIRIGQGGFRVLVTNAYSRRCCITGEKTLPTLEASHIKPYSESGPNTTSNGLLLRSDIHRLFDYGYLTVTKDLRVEVSTRIGEDYANGREYYKFHGNRLMIIPDQVLDRPSVSFLDWHNENIYRS